MEDEDVSDFNLEVDDNPEVEDTSEAEVTSSIQLEEFEHAAAKTASVWYDKLDERVKTRGFEDVARAFLERYNEQKHTYVSLFKMQQLPGESAEQYDTRFLKQAWTDNWREHGLSGSMKNYVNIKEPQSVEQVRRYAVLAEKNCTSMLILMFF